MRTDTGVGLRGRLRAAVPSGGEGPWVCRGGHGGSGSIWTVGAECFGLAAYKQRSVFFSVLKVEKSKKVLCLVRANFLVHRRPVVVQCHCVAEAAKGSGGSFLRP